MLVYDQPRSKIGEGTPLSVDQPRLPVTIVTGYLGSGKTTLVAALLRQPDMAGTAVIVNELAEVGIDQSVIADAGASGVILLSNGCLCCARGGDLANAVRQLVGVGQSRAQGVRRLLIETSGASDPGPLVREICFDPQLRTRLRYGGILCLFDAAFGPAHVARDPVGYRQFALADMILVTKVDMVTPADLSKHVAWLRCLNPVCPVTIATSDANAFLGGADHNVGRAGSSAWLGGAAVQSMKAHDAELGAWSIRASAAIDWPTIEQAMRIIYDRHGDQILRTKGIIFTQDDPRPMVIHGINRHFHRPFRLDRWEAEPSTRMVMIGFPGALEAVDEIADRLGGVLTHASVRR